MDAEPIEHLARALEIFDALQRCLYDARTGLYRRADNAAEYETLWPFANAWAAIAALQTATVAHEQPNASVEQVLANFSRAVLGYAGSRARSDQVLALRSAVSRSRLLKCHTASGATYFDDNAWIALALLQEFGIAHDAQCLEMAERVFSFVCSGWVQLDWSRPGGIRWADTSWSHGRNACSNAPAAEVAAELYLLTDQVVYLEWAQQIYHWLWGALRLENGLIADSIAPDGTVDATVWSYNQGSALGAAVLLFEATGDMQYLSQAQQVASAARHAFGDPAVLARQPPAFAAIYLRNLLLYDMKDSDEAHPSLAQGYADHLWQHCRDESGLIAFDASVSLNTTAPAIAVESLLAGAPPYP